MTITGPGDAAVELIPADSCYAQLWWNWRAQPDARAYMPLKQSTVEELHQRLSRASSDLTDHGAAEYIWFVRRNGIVAGMVGVNEVNWQMSHCEITYMVEPAFHRQGIAWSATRRLLDVIFTVTDLHRVFATVAVGNEASLGVVRKLGFRLEGELRDHYRIEGRFVSQAIWGLLRSEWSGVAAIQ